MGIGKYERGVIKMAKRLAFVIGLSIVFCFLLVLFFVLLPWIMTLGFSLLEPNPPVPKITYGEFPFRIEYRIGDETHIVEDVVICEYDGIKWDEGNGKHRKWKKRLKSNGESNLLIVQDGDISIFCNVGSAEYYMNDQSKYLKQTKFIPNLYPNKGGIFRSQKEIMEKYKLELVAWEFSEPVKNSFGW